MTKQLIAQCLFNPFMKRFMHSYCTWFPECMSAAAACDRMNNAAPGSDVTATMDLFLSSMTKHEHRIKMCDAAIFSDEENLFCRSLELHRLYTPELPKERQLAIWRGLIGGYLIVEILVRIPPPVMGQLETVVAENFRTITNGEPFDKDRFRDTAEAILLSLEDKDIEGVTKYIWEFVTSDSTPIKGLIKEEHHRLIDGVLELCRCPEAKQLLMNRIAPLIYEIKARVGTRKYTLDEHGDNPESKNPAAVPAESPDVILERKKEKSRVLRHAVDVFGSAIARNRDAIKNIVNDPAGSYRSVLAEALNAMAGTGTAQSIPMHLTALHLLAASPVTLRYAMEKALSKSDGTALRSFLSKTLNLRYSPKSPVAMDSALPMMMRPGVIFAADSLDPVIAQEWVALLPDQIARDHLNSLFDAPVVA